MFELKKKGNILYYTITSFEETGLVNHGFSTREGGVSGGCYDSMNLRFHCDDACENVLENYRLISETLGMKYENLVLSKQVHESNIEVISERHRGNGITRPNEFTSADALITDKKGIPLVTSFADCVPLFFLDKRRAVIALAHSGWRGTAARIGQKTIQEDHFEVSDDVAEIFIKEFGEDTAVKYGTRFHVNMQKAIRKQFEEEGILSENIDDCGICTYCNSELLFSHRKTNGRRGNLGAFLELKQTELV